MADLKIYSEIAFVLDQGFQTVKGKQIDDLYKRYNSTFQTEEEFERLMTLGIDAFLETPALHHKALLRGHMFQSTILALIGKREPLALARHLAGTRGDTTARVEAKAVPLQPLLDALGDPESFPDLEEFTNASTQKTNVESSKVLRFAYLKAAV